MDNNFILSLIDKFNAGVLTELKFSDGVNRLFLRKSGGEVSQAEQDNSCTQTANAVLEPVRTAEIDAAHGESVISPIIATFYSSPSPDAPPFVVPGSKVKAGETLCILEAMKMMNKLEAEFDMEILSVEVKNGDLVEFNQVLFKVRAI
ncbi:MAG: acetyl-CoA carboxylase biotin carboxyl carrier protein subunit [Treponema sp.]|jgi:acetyl-CoA carboxylase biotin carboxyl carrier protein|nr:acetyl-CoA carboxylase biotin carboxyl carrier protein subunit [Treponema sp.]